VTITNIAVLTPTDVTVVAAPYAPAGPILAGTSSTPNDVSVGGSYLWVMNELGLGFLIGTRVRASATDDVTMWIEGLVTKWDGTTVTVASDLTKGFGQHTHWSISTAGQPGQKGDKGDTGTQGIAGPPGGAPVDSPHFTGDPWAPNQSLGDNDLSIANTGFVHGLFALSQPLDADLTSLAAASAVGAIYYRSAPDTWGPVTIGSNLTFASGTLSASLTGTAPLANPIFTGDPQAPTPATADSDASIATTAFVKNVLVPYAPLASPAFTGVPTAPSPNPTDSSVAIATTAFVKLCLTNYQPLDPDLTSLAAVSASDVMVYRSAPNTWAPVVIGANLGFSGGVLTAAGGTGGSGGIPEAPNDGVLYGRRSLGWQQAVEEAPTDGQHYTRMTHTWFSVDPLFAAKANLDSPALTGAPTAPTPATADNTTAIATTAMVQAAIGAGAFAPINAPVFTGDARAVTPATADNDTSIATTAFVKNQNYAPLASPPFSGVPTAPTPAAADNSTTLATTAYVKNSFAPLAGPALVAAGAVQPTAPTQTSTDNSNAIATTAFVKSSAGFSTRDLIADLSPAGKATFDTPLLTNAYDRYELVGELSCTAASNAASMRISTDSGTTYKAGASDYFNLAMQIAQTPAVTPTFTGQAFIPIGIVNSPDVNLVAFEMHLFRPAHAGSFMRHIRNRCSETDQAGYWIDRLITTFLNASLVPITNLRIYSAGAGNFSAVSWCKLYGLK
jgi:hypothetical protein